MGIGGGGDAVGALAACHRLAALGLDTVVGGVAWERFVVDPFPGPRSLADIRGATSLGERSALAGPEAGATTPEGVHFCESRLATHLGEPTVLIDVTAGPAAAAAGITDACSELDCDLVFLLDIGGDAIAAGPEPGLASPLCDAVMIAAGVELEVPCVLGVLGAGCDGELTPEEVLERVAVLAGAGAWLDTFGVTPEAADDIEAAAAVAVTEASLLVARAARGGHGPVEIRGGRRTVQLGPVAALCFVFDVAAALAELPLVHEVAGAGSIEEARDRLNAAGVSTELDYEERRASES